MKEKGDMKRLSNKHLTPDAQSIQKEGCWVGWWQGEEARWPSISHLALSLAFGPTSGNMLENLPCALHKEAEKHST